MTDIPPIRRAVEVRAPLDTAFALFTAHIGAWWPTARHSVFGDSSLVAFEGDRLVERSESGISVWAEVLEWDPPTSLRLAWHPGHGPERATEVRVSFVTDEDVTLVTVEHSGWERTEHPAEAAQEYGNGWPTVLARFGDRVDSVWVVRDPASGARAEADADLGSEATVREVQGAGDAAREVVRSSDVDDAGKAGSAPEAKDPQWFALVHTPGPLLEDGGSVFAHPMFAEHVAFLLRLHERGLLVAAGPVFPERGEGMTVVRVEPGSGVDIDELAKSDDGAVVAGLLEVEVRAWDVRFCA